jgi:hypothetical protein
MKCTYCKVLVTGSSGFQSRASELVSLPRRIKIPNEAEEENLQSSKLQPSSSIMYMDCMLHNCPSLYIEF